MLLVKALFRVLVGIVFGLAAMVAFLPTVAAFVGGHSTSSVVMIAVVLTSALLCFSASLPRASGAGSGVVYLGRHKGFFYNEAYFGCGSIEHSRVDWVQRRPRGGSKQAIC